MFKKILIIAEAGVNHNGSFKLAKRMVQIASDAGCDAVKFQIFNSEAEISRFAVMADYQRKATNKNESLLDMTKKLELSKKEFIYLDDYCKENEIKFLASASDIESISTLEELGVDIIKVPSGEITDLPYLRKLGSLNKKVIMSSGISDLQDIGKAIKVLTQSGTFLEHITILHCNTEYPTMLEDVNLRAMLTIKDAFGVKVGYSDHTISL